MTATRPGTPTVIGAVFVVDVAHRPQNEDPVTQGQAAPQAQAATQGQAAADAPGGGAVLSSQHI